MLFTPVNLHYKKFSSRRGSLFHLFCLDSSNLIDHSKRTSLSKTLNLLVNLMVHFTLLLHKCIHFDFIEIPCYIDRFDIRENGKASIHWFSATTKEVSTPWALYILPPLPVEMTWIQFYEWSEACTLIISPKNFSCST